jgi:hypothetical protein
MKMHGLAIVKLKNKLLKEENDEGNRQHVVF